MRLGVVGIGVLLAAECVMSFAAGALSAEAVEACREKEAAMVEEIGIRGAWYKFSGSKHRVKSTVDDSLTAEMLAKALPMKISFHRNDGLLVSQMPLTLTAEGRRSSVLSPGDFIYMPRAEHLAIVIDPAKAPEDAVLLGHMDEEALETLTKEDAWTLTLGR